MEIDELQSGQRNARDAELDIDPGSNQRALLNRAPAVFIGGRALREEFEILHHMSGQEEAHEARVFRSAHQEHDLRDLEAAAKNSGEFLSSWR